MTVVSAAVAVVHFCEFGEIGMCIFSQSEQIFRRSDDGTVRRNEKRYGDDPFHLLRVQTINCGLNSTFRRHAESDLDRILLSHILRDLVDLFVPVRLSAMSEQQHADLRTR